MRLEAVVDLILYENNEMSIILTKNAKSLYCIKYINIQHHYIKELVNKKGLTISGSRMLVDEMTKVLLTKAFKKYQPLLKMAIK